MGRLKKILILSTIVSLTFGFLLSSLTLNPAKAEAKTAKVASKSQGVEAGESAVDEEDAAVAADGQVATVCALPANADIKISFGNTAGFFNTPTSVTASWSGFEGAPIKYKYKVVDVTDPEVIIPWTPTTGVSFLESLVDDLEEGDVYKVKVRAKYGPD
jgi:hypothetical protein